MSNSLVNGNFSRISKALDNVLASAQNEGADTFRDGIWKIRSRVKYNGVYENIFYPSSSGLRYANADTGKLTMITSEEVDVNENLRVNPMCDFTNNVFNSEKLVGWCGHSKEVKADDDKAGRVFITADELIDADSFSNIKTVIFDAGKAVGSCKTLLESVDVREDITSGFCAYQEFALNTDTEGEPFKLYGFHGGIDGLTGEYEVILSNDAEHCQAVKNIKTGQLTYLSTTDARYNLVPGNFSGAVSLDDYIYYIGCDGYIYKINKTTYEVVAKSSDDTNSYNVEYKKGNLFSDGSNLYYLYYYDSGSGSSYYTVDKDTLSWSGETYLETLNSPSCLLVNEYPRGCNIYSIDNNSKFVIYSNNFGIALVFTNLNDIAGSIEAEYTQFMVGGDAFALTSEGLFSYWVPREIYNKAQNNDLAEDSLYSLKVCKNTSGQVFASAEWEEAYENSGSKQMTLNVYDTVSSGGSDCFYRINWNTSESSTWQTSYVQTGTTTESIGEPDMGSKTFSYWCLDLENPVEFDFSTPITSNLTLYAYGTFGW